MENKYEPGQRIKLTGDFGGYPATVKKVNNEFMVIQFDDLDNTTTILKEQIRLLEIDGEIEIEG